MRSCRAAPQQPPADNVHSTGFCAIRDPDDHQLSMSRHRPTLWQYVSFSRPSSRFSDRDELPLSASGDADPYEKRSRGGSGLYSPPSYNSDLDKPAWKTPGQRSRYLKLGGALALILLVLYVFKPGEKAKDRQGELCSASHTVQMLRQQQDKRL